MENPAWLDDVDLFREQVRLIGRQDLTEEQIQEAFGKARPANNRGWSDGTWLMWLRSILSVAEIDTLKAVVNEEHWHPLTPGSSGCGKPIGMSGELRSHLARPIGQRTKLGHTH